jgi:signal transduction histidine kinase
MSSQDYSRHVGRLAELGLLTATLNHELRQPLFAIKSLAQLMLAGGEDSPQLREILQQVALMEQLVEGVSAFSRHAPQTLSPVDPAGPVRQAVTLLRHRARRRGVTVETWLAEDAPAIRGDATALLQVVVNLVQNAIDASPRGGRVRIAVAAAAARVHIDVLDEGPGVPPELREKIFEAFYTTKAPGVGTGLGLSIARELVEAGDGELTLLETGGGAHVRIALPTW